MKYYDFLIRLTKTLSTADKRQPGKNTFGKGGYLSGAASALCEKW